MILLENEYLELEEPLTEVYPNKGESKKDFISRFMSVTKDEYPNQKQRYAVALSYWDRKDRKTESVESEETSSDIENVQSPEELMDWMNDNIEYHLESQSYEEENPDERPTQTAEELIKSGNGHCAEQSYLEQYILEKLGYKTQLVFVKENNSKHDYGYNGSAHIFLVYEDNGKYYWFEHAMEHARGIHEYSSMEALMNDVSERWWKCRYEGEDVADEELADMLEFRLIDKPIVGISNLELAKRMYKYPIEYVADISNNEFEPQEEDSINESIEYNPISSIDDFNDSHKQVFGKDSNMSDSDVKESMKEIVIDGEIVGYIGFSIYDDIKALGIGNFMILPQFQGRGYGSKVIKDLVEKYKSKYDLIYCYVDKDNKGAIKLYKKLGKVYDDGEPNEDGEFYVTFYDKNNYTE